MRFEKKLIFCNEIFCNFVHEYLCLFALYVYYVYFITFIGINVFYANDISVFCFNR